MKQTFDYYLMLAEEILFSPNDNAPASFYLNPTNQELQSIGGNARGIITDKGNVILTDAKILHRNILNFLLSKEMTQLQTSNWQKQINNFVCVKQRGKLLDFVLADSYSSDILKKENVEKIQKIIAAAKNNKDGVARQIAGSTKIEISKDNS